MGHKRRALLAIRTAHHVLPRWNQVWPTDARPVRLVNEAERVVQESLEAGRATGHGDQYWTWLAHAVGEYEDKVSLYAGFSLVTALFVAIENEHFDPRDLDSERTDADVDVYAHDTTFFAAAADAGGSLWEPASNPAQRDDCWQWWLLEAVPAADQLL